MSDHKKSNDNYFHEHTAFFGYVFTILALGTIAYLVFG